MDLGQVFQERVVGLASRQIDEVLWNIITFQSLVFDSTTKQLIKAPISNRIAADESTDLTSVEENGLIFLLPRPPRDGEDFDSRKRCGKCSEAIILGYLW